MHDHAATQIELDLEALCVPQSQLRLSHNRPGAATAHRAAPSRRKASVYTMVILLPIMSIVFSPFQLPTRLPAPGPRSGPDIPPANDQITTSEVNNRVPTPAAVRTRSARSTGNNDLRNCVISER